jgi:hypothetical protein
LLPLTLVATALLVVAYIVGSELCLPSARSALRTGNAQLWRTACRLVALGEWAMIVIGLSFLLLAEHLWHWSDGAWPGRLAGLLVAAILAGVVVWELAGRTRKNIAGVMSRSLDLVLPRSGAQRALYTRERRRLESGSRAEREQVLRHLFHDARPGGE